MEKNSQNKILIELYTIINNQLKGISVIRFYDFYNLRNESYTVHIVYSDGITNSIEYLNELDKEVILNFLIGVTK